MSEWLAVLLVALLPALGNLAGGLLAELWKPSPRWLNLALHAASGIVIAVVSVELLQEALAVLAGWWIALAFVAGGAAYVVIDSGARRVRQGGSSGAARAWMIYIAVAIDLASDGLLIGSASAIAPGFALILASGQVLADVPEGYATTAAFREHGFLRGRRVLLSLSFLLYVLGVAGLSYWGLRTAKASLKAAVLCFVGGLLTVAAVEDMLEEAHDATEDTRWSVMAFVIGFALFTFTSAGLERWLRVVPSRCDKNAAGTVESWDARSTAASLWAMKLPHLPTWPRGAASTSWLESCVCFAGLRENMPSTPPEYWKEQLGVVQEFAHEAPMEAVQRLRVVMRQIREALVHADQASCDELVDLLHFGQRLMRRYEHALLAFQHENERRALQFEAHEMAALAAPLPIKS